MRGETARVEVLEKNRPQITVDHLVKERYPTFMDALRGIVRAHKLTDLHLRAQ